MDTAKKILKDKETCHYCLNYQSLYKGTTRLCKGKCRVTGTIKKRTDYCKRCFVDKRQVGLF